VELGRIEHVRADEHLQTDVPDPEPHLESEAQDATDEPVGLPAVVVQMLQGVEEQQMTMFSSLPCWSAFSTVRWAGPELARTQATLSGHSIGPDIDRVQGAVRARCVQSVYGDA
jgi:hypothetical protein